MTEVPEMRPMVVVNQEEGESELTAAMWDPETHWWRTSDGRGFDGPPPERAPETIVAVVEPSGFDVGGFLEAAEK